MPIKLIGRTTDFKGKSLWEILGNLKNFGVGRIIIRNRFQRYPEPTYIKVLKVGALPNETSETGEVLRKVMILAERVFRGRKDKKIVQIDSASYKTDYVLIPKDEEYKFKPLENHKEIIMPRTTNFPPLMQELIIRRLKAKGEDVMETPQIPLWYNEYGNKLYRVANEGETPTVKVTMGFGKPASPSLYANCKPI